MNLTHRLRLPVPPDQAWAAFCDPRRLVQAVPGASVEAHDGDRFTGTLKVKLGPLALAFDGSLELGERDRGDGRVVWRTRASDRRGHGTAQARHTIVFHPVGAAGLETDAEIHSELNLTGRPGQLGRGVVSEAANRLIDRFGTRTAARVAEGLPWLPEAEESSDVASETGASARAARPDGAPGEVASPETVVPPPAPFPAHDPWRARVPSSARRIASVVPWLLTAALSVAVAVRLVRRRTRS